MAFSIIQSSLINDNINLLNTVTDVTTAKYNPGLDVKKILLNNGKTHIVSISRFDNKIVYYNLATSTIVHTITTVTRPITGVFSHDDNYLYVIAQASNLLYKISLNTPTPTVTITALSIKPTRIVRDLLTTKLYLAGNYKWVSVVTTASFTETSLIQLTTSETPVILADFKFTPDYSTLIYIDSNARRVFAVLIATNAINMFDLTPYSYRLFLMNCVISANSQEIFILARYRTSGNVVKLNLNTGVLSYVMIQTYPTRIYDLQLSTDGSSLYLQNIINKSIQVVTSTAIAPVATINLAQAPYFFFKDPLTTFGYAVNKNSGLVIEVNTATNTAGTSAYTNGGITEAIASNL